MLLMQKASHHIAISRSLCKAYGKEIDQTRVSDVNEISGEGVTAVVDGTSVAAGNIKLMKRLGIECKECGQRWNRCSCGS